MVRLFKRGETDAEKRARAEARSVSAAELERERLEDIKKDEQSRVAREIADRQAARDRREKYDARVREVRESEALKKAEVRAKADAESAGRTPGARIIHGAARVVGAAQKIASGRPQPSSTVVRTEETVGGKKVVTERHYAPPAPGGGLFIPAFSMAGTRQRRTVPIRGGAAAKPAPKRAAGYSFPALAGLGNVGVAPGLRAPGAAPAKKRGKTGIPFLDNPW